MDDVPPSIHMQNVQDIISCTLLLFDFNGLINRFFLV